MKNSKKYNILSILLLICINLHAIAQSKLEIDLKNQIQRSLIGYYNTHGSEFFEKSSYKNSAFTFGIAISIDKNGLMDNITFSNKTALLDSIVSFDSITAILKSQRSAKVFLNYENTVFVCVALVRKGWEHSIENLEEFDKYFYNLIPNLEGISPLKKVRFLPAFSMVQGRKRY